MSSGPSVGDASVSIDGVTGLGSTDLTLGSDGTRSQDHDEVAPGTAIGRYLVLSRLGAGGMGVVYLAYDPELDRRVALKLLRTSTGKGVDGRARQLLEAQALARLSHPNVVTVYDVGTFSQRVWLAMEHIDGSTLAKWCKERVRSWSEVLAVLVAAGRGLAAAHAAGMVHRDFKPDNVMIADDGRVLVMDFGLARALGDDIGAPGASNTRLRASLDSTRAHGTPGYMAPEQHRATSVDGRSDQFGFGVTLWEALWGERPFKGETLGALVLAIGNGEIQSPPPARRVPRWLRRALERALDPDPQRRWPSMEALLDELHRGQTRLRRRWITAAAVVVASSVAAVLVVRQLQHRGAVQACEAEGATIDATWPGNGNDVRDSMRAAFVAAASAGGDASFERVAPRLDEWSAAWRELATAECTHAIDGRDPALHAAATACLAERREGFAALVETFAEPDGPVIRRAVVAAAGLARPEPCADDADLMRRTPPPADSTERVAELRRDLERARSQRLAGRLDLARATIAGVVDGAEELGWPPLHADAMLESGRIIEKAGDPAGGENPLQSAYLTAIAADEPGIAADAAIGLVALVGVRLARPDEARLWGLHAEALLQRLGETEGLRAASLAVNRATLERQSSNYDAAIVHLQHATELRRAALGDEHPDVAAAWNNLGNVHFERGDYVEAAELFERAVAMWESALGPDHPDTAQAIHNLGNAYFARKDHEGAERSYAHALEVRERVLGVEHPDVAQSLLNLGAVAYDRGDFRKSTEYFSRALAIDRRVHPGGHPDVARDLGNLGMAAAALEDYAAAEAHFDEALAVLERVSASDHADYGRTLRQRGAMYLGRGDEQAAARDMEMAVALLERHVGADHFQTMLAKVTLGEIRLDQGRPEEGEALCRSVLQRSGKDLSATDSVIVWNCIARAELARGRAREALDDAERALREGEAGGAAAHDMASLHHAIGLAAWESGDRARARAAMERARDDSVRPAGRAAAETWLRAHAK